MPQCHAPKPCEQCQIEAEIALLEAERFEPSEEQQISWNEANDYMNEADPEPMEDQWLDGSYEES